MPSGKRPNLQGGGDRANSQEVADLKASSIANGSAGANPTIPSSSATAQTTGSTRPSRRGRAERGPRTLVRWDNDLDIQLLLTLQQACNATGVKIPWQTVAETMGPRFTEGAIIQHLSKVRMRREAEDKPVPPPLRRSIPSQGSSSKRKRPAQTPTKKELSHKKTTSIHSEKDIVGSVKKCLFGDDVSVDDPSWSQEEGPSRSRSGKRTKTKVQRTHGRHGHHGGVDDEDPEEFDLEEYEDGTEEDTDEDAEGDIEEAEEGNPFMDGSRPSTTRVTGEDMLLADSEVLGFYRVKTPSRQVDIGEVGLDEPQPERLIVKLPVSGTRLQGLETEGTVFTPVHPTPESRLHHQLLNSALNRTPTPLARHSARRPRASPIQNTEQTLTGSPRHGIHQVQGSSGGDSTNPYPQNFAPPVPAMNDQAGHGPFYQGPGNYPQSFQPPLTWAPPGALGGYGAPQQIYHNTLLPFSTGYSMPPGFAGAYQDNFPHLTSVTSSPSPNIDPELGEAGVFPAPDAGSSLSLPILKRESETVAENRDQTLPDRNPTLPDIDMAYHMADDMFGGGVVDWDQLGDSAVNQMASSPEPPEGNDTKIDL